jgi:transposase
MHHDAASVKDWKEARRKRALELKAQGWRQREIAAALGVSAAAVSKWVQAAQAAGWTLENEVPEAAGWRAKPHRGAAPKLTPSQLWLLPDLLCHGATAYGFRGEFWSCSRVATLIHQEFGVRYHRGHVARLLKKLNWTSQLPLRQAAQRDEETIEHWRLEVWPALKKGL